MQKQPKIVLLDNNDSFTFNFVELLRQLVGAEPIILSHQFEGEIPEADAYIFSPGPGLPNEKPLMHKVLDRYANHKAILGICLGHQSIAEYYGATLFNLGILNHGVQIEVKHEGDLLYEHVSNPFYAALYHSWAVDFASIEHTDLLITASWNKVVMGLKHKTLNICGFQFHPESFLTEEGKQLIANWLKRVDF